MGLLYYWIGDLDKSKIYLEKSLQIYLKCLGDENNIDVARNYTNLGAVFLD